MSPSCPMALVEQYEALRPNTVASSLPGVAAMGAILVVKTGVAGWVREWSRIAAGSLTPPSPLPRIPAESGWRSELTLLLAQITVRHLRLVP
jgi:hypothetical protein